MSDDKVVIPIEADVDGFKKAFKSAKKDATNALDKIENAQKHAASASRKHAGAIKELASSMDRSARTQSRFAAVLGKVKSSLDANSQKIESFKSNLTGEFDAAVKSSLGPLGNLASGLTSLVNPVTVAAGAIAATGTALAKLGAETANTYDSIGDMANQVGMTAESLSRYRTAAVDFVVPLEDIARAHGVLAKRAFDAASGNARAEKTFKALGIEIKNADGSLKDAETLFGEVSTATKALGSDVERVALAQKVFGDDVGRKLVPLLSQGADGLEQAKKKAEEYGLVIGGNAVAATQRYIQAQKDLNNQWQGLKETIGKTIIPGLADYISAVNVAIETWKRWLGIQARTPEEQRKVNDEVARLNAELSKTESKKRELEYQVMFGRQLTETGKDIHEQIALLERRAHTLRHAIAATKEDIEAEKERAAQVAKTSALDAVSTESVSTHTKAVEQHAKEVELAAQAIARIELDVVRTRETAAERSLRIEEERVAEVLRLAEIAGRSEEQTQALIAEIRKQGAAEREKIRQGEVAEYQRFADSVLAVEETAVQKSIRLEQERVAQAIELSKQVGASEEETQRLITEIHRQGAEERAKIAEKEAQQEEKRQKKIAKAKRNLVVKSTDAIIASMDELEEAGILRNRRAFQVAKAAAVSAATVKAALAVVDVFANTPGELIMKTVAATLAGIQGAAMVAKIAATPAPSFEVGGPVYGPRHKGSAQGGVPILAEGGEVVFSRRDVNNLGGIRAVEDMRRSGGMGQTTVVMTLDRRVFGKAVVDQARQNRDFRRILRSGPVGVIR